MTDKTDPLQNYPCTLRDPDGIKMPEVQKKPIPPLSGRMTLFHRVTGQTPAKPS